MALLERQDLQRLVRESPAAQKALWGEELLLFAEEFANWQDSERRIDLLALDKDGNLVVIELKRDKEGAHMELQALRYAAMVAPLDFAGVVSAYSHFSKISPEVAEEKLLAWLEVEDAQSVSIGSQPRIFLLGRGFGRELTTTVLYLNEFGLDIRCIQLVPYVVNGQKLLAAQTVIPIPNAGDYMVKLGAKAQTSDKAKAQKAKSLGDVVPFLVEQGVLTQGTIVHLIKIPSRSDFAPIEVSEEQKTAFYEDKIYFRWCGERTSLTGICKALFKQAHGIEKPFAGPSHFALEGQSKHLGEVARELAEGIQNPAPNDQD